MTDFIANLSSLYWWISVVVVGILVNVCSTYLQKVLDSRMSRTSDWWRQRSLQRQAIYDWKVAKLRQDTNYKFVILAGMIVDSLISLGLLIMAVIALVIVSAGDTFQTPISDLPMRENILVGIYLVGFCIFAFFSFLSLKNVVTDARIIRDAIGRTEEGSDTDPFR